MGCTELVKLLIAAAASALASWGAARLYSKTRARRLPSFPPPPQMHGTPLLASLADKKRTRILTGFKLLVLRRLRRTTEAELRRMERWYGHLADIVNPGFWRNVEKDQGPTDILRYLFPEFANDEK